MVFRIIDGFGSPCYRRTTHPRAINLMATNMQRRYIAELEVFENDPYLKLAMDTSNALPSG